MNEQQRLLNAIWSDEPSVLAQSGFNAQGINIYRRNLLANAQRALSISYPTIFELLDGDVSDNLTHQFLKRSPPHQGDWAQWGETLANFVATTGVGDDYPYLSDCAALDWHIHCALHGKDQTFDRSSLQLLGDIEPEHIIVEFNQNVTLLKTQYPITDIFQAHHHSIESQRAVAMNKAQEALSLTPVEHIVMVYRPEFQPQVTKLTTREGEFMRCLMSGKSLAQSLDVVSHDCDFSFEKWLITAIEHNLIYHFKEN